MRKNLIQESTDLVRLGGNYEEVRSFLLTQNLNEDDFRYIMKEVDSFIMDFELFKATKAKANNFLLFGYVLIFLGLLVFLFPLFFVGTFWYFPIGMIITGSLIAFRSREHLKTEFNELKIKRKRFIRKKWS